MHSIVSKLYVIEFTIYAGRTLLFKPSEYSLAIDQNGIIFFTYSLLKML